MRLTKEQIERFKKLDKHPGAIYGDDMLDTIDALEAELAAAKRDIAAAYERGKRDVVNYLRDNWGESDFLHQKMLALQDKGPK